ncbi:MAG: substrate-binding domain-containing protein [Actinomycetia bacterium]|nr:substrate-binding domain-containing protein [Actinomycetes bacterium]
MKKILIYVVVLVISISMVAAFSLTGCKKEAAPATTEAAETTVAPEVAETTAAPTEEVVAEKAYKFVFTTHDAGTPFWVPTVAGYKHAAEIFGVTVEFIGPKTFDIAAQVDMTETAIEGDIDGLAITLPAEAAYDGGVQKAIDKGIIVVGYNTDDPTPNARMVFVGQDQIKAGMRMGEEIKKYLPDGGEVILSTCCPGHSAIEQRLAGARTALEGSNVTVIGDNLNYGADMTEAVGKIEAAHLANPDVDGIYSVDAYTEAIGMYISINNLKGKLLGGGFDLVEGTLNFIKDGVLQFTIGQDPYSQGFYPVVIMWLYVDKGIPPKDVDTGAEVVDKNNIEQILAREAKWAE